MPSKDFEELLNAKNYSIGDIAVMREKTIKKRGKLKFAAVAALFLALIGAGTVAYASPYYYVSMDVNPSIIMKVNIFQRVIGIEAVNEDAKAIVEKLEVKNKGVEDAICSAVQQLEQTSYLKENKGEILLSTACGSVKNAEKLSLKVKLAAQGELQKNQLQNQVYSTACTKEMVRQANQLGISPGKLNLIQNMLGEEVGDNADESIQNLMNRYETKQRTNYDSDQPGVQEREQTMQQNQTGAQGTDSQNSTNCDGTGTNSGSNAGSGSQYGGSDSGGRK